MIIREIDVLTYKSQTSLDASGAFAVRNSTDNSVEFTNLIVGDYDLYYLSLSPSTYTERFLPIVSNPLTNITSNSMLMLDVTPSLTIVSATFIQPIDAGGTYAYTKRTDVTSIVSSGANTTFQSINFPVSYAAFASAGIADGYVDSNGTYHTYVENGILEIVYSINSISSLVTFDIGDIAYINTNGILSKTQRKLRFEFLTIGTNVNTLYFTPISMNTTGYTFGNTLTIPVNTFIPGAQYFIRMIGVPSGIISLGDNVSNLIDINDDNFDRTRTSTFDGINKDTIYVQDATAISRLEEYATVTYGKRDKYYPYQIESIQVTSQIVTTFINRFINLPYCTTTESAEGEFHTLSLYFTIDFSAQYPTPPIVDFGNTYSYQASNILSAGSGLFNIVPRLNETFLSKYSDYLIFNNQSDATIVTTTRNQVIADIVGSLPTGSVNAAGFLENSNAYKYFTVTTDGSRTFYAVPFSIRINSRNGVAYRFLSFATQYVTMTYSNANALWTQALYPSLAISPLHVDVTVNPVYLYPTQAGPTGYTRGVGYFNLYFQGSKLGNVTTIYGLLDRTVYDSFELEWVYTAPGLPNYTFPTKFISDRFQTDIGLTIPNRTFLTVGTPNLQNDVNLTSLLTFNFNRTAVTFGSGTNTLAVGPDTTTIPTRFGLVLDDGQEVDFGISTTNKFLVLSNLLQARVYNSVSLRYYPFAGNTNVPLLAQLTGSRPIRIPDVSFTTPITDVFSANVASSTDNSMTLSISVNAISLMQNIGFSTPTPTSNLIETQYALLFNVGNLPLGAPMPYITTPNSILDISPSSTLPIPPGYKVVLFTNTTTGNLTPDPISFKVTNLKRNLNYTGFNVSLCLIVDYTKNSNQLYIPPVLFTPRLPIEYIPDGITYSFQSSGVLTNFDFAINTGYTGSVGAVDISYPTLNGATINVVGPTGINHGALTTLAGPIYPIQALRLGINRNILPNSTYSGLSIKYSYPGGTVTLANIPTFSTSSATLPSELFQTSGITVTPDIYNATISVANFDYNVYSISNSLPAAWGGSLLVKDSVTGVTYGILNLSQNDIYPKTVNVYLNQRLLSPQTTYSDMYIEYRYGSNVGAIIYAIPSFKTPLMTLLNNFQINPLSTRVIVDVGTSNLFGNTPFSTSQKNLLVGLQPAGTTGIAFQQISNYSGITGGNYRTSVNCLPNTDYDVIVKYQYNGMNYSAASVLKTITTLGNQIVVGNNSYILGNGTNIITLDKLSYVGTTKSLAGGNILFTDLNTNSVIRTVPTQTVLSKITFNGLFTSQIYKYAVSYQSPASIALGIFDTTALYNLPEFVPSLGLANVLKITNFTVVDSLVYVSIVDIFINGLRFNGSSGLRINSTISGVTPIVNGAISVLNGATNFTFTPSALRPYSTGSFTVSFVVNGLTVGSVVPLPAIDFGFTSDITDIKYQQTPSPGYYGTIQNLKYAGQPVFNSTIGVFNATNPTTTIGRIYDLGYPAEQNFSVASAPLITLTDYQSSLSTLTTNASNFVGVLQTSPNFRITSQSVGLLNSLRVGAEMTNLQSTLLQIAYRYSSVYPTTLRQITKQEFYQSVASLIIPGFTIGRILANSDASGTPYSAGYTIGISDILDFVYYYFFQHYTANTFRIPIIRRQDAPPLTTNGVQEILGATVSPMVIRYKYPYSYFNSETAYSPSGVSIPFPSVIYDTTINNGVLDNDIDAIAVIRENIAYGMIRTWNQNDVYDGSGTQDRNALIAKHTYSRWIFGTTSTVNYAPGATGFSSLLDITSYNPQLLYTGVTGLTGYSLVTNSDYNRTFSFNNVQLGNSIAASALVPDATSLGKRYLYKNKNFGRLLTTTNANGIYSLTFQFGSLNATATETFIDITNFPYILLFQGDFPNLTFKTAISINLANVNTTSPEFIIATDTPFTTLTGTQNEWLAPYRFIRNFDSSPTFNTLGTSLQSPVYTTPGTYPLSTTGLDVTYTYGVTGPVYNVNINDQEYTYLYNEWIDFGITGGANMRLYFTPRESFPARPAQLTLINSTFRKLNGSIVIADPSFGISGRFNTNLLFTELPTAQAIKNKTVYSISGKGAISPITSEVFYKLYVVPYNFTSSKSVYSNLYTFANFIYTLRNSDIIDADKILGIPTVSSQTVYYSSCVVSISGLNLIDDMLEPPLVGPIPSIASTADYLVVTDSSGNAIKTVSLTGFSFGSGTTNTFKLTGLTESTLYSGLRIYYKFATKQTQEVYNYLTIPNFLTPPEFALDAGFNLCITKAVINIADIVYSGRRLSSTFPVSSSSNTLSLRIFSSTDSNVSTPTVNYPITSSFTAPFTVVVPGLVQGDNYDKIGFTYSVIDELGVSDTATINSAFPPTQPNVTFAQDEYTMVASWTQDPNLRYNLQFYTNTNGSTGGSAFGSLLTNVTSPVYTTLNLTDGAYYFAHVTPISFGFSGNTTISSIVQYDLPTVTPSVVFSITGVTGSASWQTLPGLTYSAQIKGVFTQTPLPSPVPAWQATIYSAGSIVQHDGSIWVALRYVIPGAGPFGGYINVYWKAYRSDDILITNATSPIQSTIQILDGYYYSTSVTPYNKQRSGVTGISQTYKFIAEVVQPTNSFIGFPDNYHATAGWTGGAQQQYTTTFFESLTGTTGGSSVFEIVNGTTETATTSNVLLDGRYYYARIESTNLENTPILSTTTPMSSVYSVPLVTPPDLAIATQEYRLNATWTPTYQLTYKAEFYKTTNPAAPLPGDSAASLFETITGITNGSVYTTKILDDMFYYFVVVTPSNLQTSGVPAISLPTTLFDAITIVPTVILTQGDLTAIATWNPLQGLTYALQYYESSTNTLGSVFGSLITNLSSSPATSVTTTDGKYYTATLTPLKGSTNGVSGTSNRFKYIQPILEPYVYLNFSDNVGITGIPNGVTGVTINYLTANWIAQPQIQYVTTIFESISGVTGANDGITFQGFTGSPPITTITRCNDGKYYYATVLPSNVEGSGSIVTSNMTSQYQVPLVDPTNIALSIVDGICTVSWNTYPGLYYSVELWGAANGGTPFGVEGGTNNNATSPVTFGSSTLILGILYYAFVTPRNLQSVGNRIFSLLAGGIPSSINYSFIPLATVAQSSSNILITYVPEENPLLLGTYNNQYFINVYSNTIQSRNGSELVKTIPAGDASQTPFVNYGSYGFTGTLRTASAVASLYTSYSITTNYQTQQTGFTIGSYATLQNGSIKMHGIITSFSNDTVPATTGNLTFFSLVVETGSGTNLSGNMTFTLINDVSTKTPIILSRAALTTLNPITQYADGNQQLADGKYYFAEIGYENIRLSNYLRYTSLLTSPPNVTCLIDVDGQLYARWYMVSGITYQLQFYYQDQSASSGIFAGTLLDFGTISNIVSAVSGSQLNSFGGELLFNKYFYAVVTPRNHIGFGTPVYSTQNVNTFYNQSATIQFTHPYMRVSWASFPYMSLLVDLFSSDTNSTNGGTLVSSTPMAAGETFLLFDLANYALNKYYYAVVRVQREDKGLLSATTPQNIYVPIFTRLGIDNPTGGGVNVFVENYKFITYGNLQGYSNTVNSNSGGTPFGTGTAFRTDAAYPTYLTTSAGVVGTTTRGRYYYATFTYSNNVSSGTLVTPTVYYP